MINLDPSSVLSQRPKGRFQILLVSLVLYIFFVPAIENLVHLKFLFDIFLTLVLIAAIYAVSVRTAGFIVGVALAMPMIVSIWLAHVVAIAAVTIAGRTFAILFMCYTALVILRFIMSQKTITANIIYASIVVYLLMGVGWALVYSLIHDLQPASFAYGDLALGQDMVFFVYYSFTTLTTLGYGDVTPLAPAAVSLSAFEAVIGQLYLAVLVARLVGLHISQSKNAP